MYWLLWMMIGLSIVAIFSTCVLPRALRSGLNVIKGSEGKYKVLYVLILAALFSAAVFLFVFIIATFVYNSVGGLEVGAGKAAPFVVWTLFVFLGVMAVSFTLGMTLIKREGESGGKIDLRFMLPRIKLDCSYKLGVVFDILFAILLVFASIMMALFFDYLLVRLFGTTPSKWILLVLLVVVVGGIGVIERKSLRIKENLPKAVIPLTIFFVAYYIILMVATREAVDWIFIVGGSTLLISIVMFYIWSLVSRRSKRNLEKNKIR